MARLMLALLLVTLSVTKGQGFVLVTPDESSLVTSAEDQGWDDHALWKTTRNVANDVDQRDVSRAAEKADDKAMEKALTTKEKKVGKPVNFPITSMADDVLIPYLNLEDKILLSETDEHVGFKLLNGTRKGLGLVQSRHTKRGYHLIGSAVFSVARSVFSRFARQGITRSGSRVTRHYVGRGTYRNAVRDFKRLRPDNVRTFKQGRISGRTGTVGNHRVTVRNGSKGNSRPTMEVRSHGGKVVRKFRYNGN